MERKTAADFDQELLILFDAYVHGAIDRRGFLDKAKKFAVGGMTAAMVLDALNPKFAEAQQVAPDDKRLKAGDQEYPSPQGSGTMKGYLVRPNAAAGPLGGVIVIHENRGLNPHVRDVARRMALEGFVALAPDFLSLAGGTPDNEDQAREMIGKLDPAATVANAEASLAFLAKRDGTNGKVGAVGFCWGGGLVNRFATKSDALTAGVAYYGAQPPAEDVPDIKAALLLHYAGLDERINAGIEAYRKALEAGGKSFEIHVYDGVNHAFNNDTSAARYDKAAADLAWQRTVAFLKKNLG